MKRMWPDEFDYIFDHAEEVTLEAPAFLGKDGLRHDAIHRQALRVSLPEQDFERIWPLAEARYRLSGKWSGKAVTLIANNPHYHSWHPADDGTTQPTGDGGAQRHTRHVVAHFLLDVVQETAAA
jgi:hypothetical protein